MRAVFYKDVEEFYKVLKKSIIALEEIEQKEQGTEYFEVLIRYIMNARNDIGIREIYELTKEISLERSEEIMTIAEQLIQEGFIACASSKEISAARTTSAIPVIKKRKR